MKSYLSQLNEQLAHPKPSFKKERVAKKRARSEKRTKFHHDVMYAARGKCENVVCVSLMKRNAERLHAHHILYRSDCGPDTVENGIALCPTCHHRAHNGFDDPSGDRMSGRRWMLKILDLIKKAHPERFRWNEAYAGLRQIVENKESHDEEL